MAPRANWKGVLKIGDVGCGVALYTAASTAERIIFHILNRKTGHRVHRQFVDSETGKPVPAEDQVKGYETEAGGYIRFEADEIAKAVPDSDKTLAVEAFIDCGEVDELHFDRPYYLAPAAPGDVATFDALRNAMRAAGVAAVARAVLFRRVRSVLVRAHGKGLIATTLKFDYEVRSPDEAFRDLPEAEVDKEMLDLALHIIKTKRGRFDPSTFDDRYEAAVQALVAAKLEGRELVPQKPPAPTPEGDLLAALRRSAGRPRPGRAKTGSGKAARRRAA